MSYKNFFELSKDKAEWVKLSRKINVEKGIRKLLTELYPDKAHFIYELLQNAEDTRATWVKFALFPDRLEFTHNGLRLFNLNDIESITGIGESTKSDDVTTIGKFGVGFKAVFSYTETPEIHSGDYHFKIQDLVVPTSIPAVQNLQKNLTHFVFPFNSKKAKEKCVREISNGLLELNQDTLMFLTHISEIEYALPSNASGRIVRTTNNENELGFDIYKNGKLSDHSDWLRFTKIVNVPDEESSNVKKACQIAIAYQLNFDNKKSKFSIVPAKRGNVAIYFPAVKENSNLKFHIHAPFASTVARDSVRNTDGNDHLFDEIRQLILDSFTLIKDKGLLSIDFLETLPNEDDFLTGPYSEIYDSIVKEFQTKALLPTKDGNYGKATDLYVAPNRVTNVLTTENMEVLFQRKGPFWLEKGSNKNKRVNTFLESIECCNWDLDVLENRIFDFKYSKIYRNKIKTWIENKSDSFVRKFYAALGYSGRDCYHCNLSFLPIFRVEVKSKSGITTDHIDNSEAIYQLENKDDDYSENLYFLKSSLVFSDNKDEQIDLDRFCDIVGIKVFNEYSLIENLLETKYGKYRAKGTVTQSHVRDVMKIIRYSKKADKKVNAKRFILDSDGYFRPPYCLYVDKPYIDTGFGNYFDTVNSEYANYLSSSQLAIFIEFLEKNARTSLEIEETCIEDRNKHYDSLMEYYWGRRTNTQIDIDWTIESIDEIVSKPNTWVSKNIWNLIVNAESEVAFAKYRPNQTFATKTESSVLVQKLSENAWVPDKDGKFHKPCDIYEDLLPEGFEISYENGLLEAIHFGENVREVAEKVKARKALLEEYGIHDEKVLSKVKSMARAKGYTSFEDFLEAASQHTPEKKQKSEFPNKRVKNPSVRAEQAFEEGLEAQEKTYVTSERSVRRKSIDATESLRRRYTNDKGVMFCQLCQKELPFKKRDGHYYFEKKEIFRKDLISKDFLSHYLCLCPLCAAKFEELIKKDDDKLLDLYDRLISIENFEEGIENLEFELNFGTEKMSLKFDEAHLIDLLAQLQSE